MIPESVDAESGTVAVLQSFGGTREYHDSDAALETFPCVAW
jgi:hypothetical protein